MTTDSTNSRRSSTINQRRKCESRKKAVGVFSAVHRVTLDLSDSRLEIIVRMQVVGAIAILRTLLADAECLIAR